MADTARFNSFTPVNPAHTFKREAPIDANTEAPPSKKRPGSSVAFDNSSHLMHVRASGQRVRPEDLFTENDELVQNLHQQDAKANGTGGNTSDEDGESFHECEDVLGDAAGDEDAPEKDAHEFDYLDREQDDGDDDDDDLYAKVFGKEKALKVEEVDSDCEIIESTANIKSNGKGKQRAIDHIDHDPTEHAAGCHTARSASTPPLRSRVNKSSSAKPQGPREADLDKDVRRSLKLQEKMHLKAKQYTPRLELAAHRYWICVLHPGKRVSTINSEKNFTWMRGNRVTTIQTIWHTYQQNTLMDKFVLLHGFERVDFKDKCEELDYHNDHFICLRAVKESAPDAKGKDLSEGLIPEIIEIGED